MAEQFRKQLTDPDAAVTVLSKLERRTQNAAAWRLLASIGVWRDWSSGKLIQSRLIVEEIDMAWPAPHEQEDDSFGSCSRMSQSQCRIACVRRGSRRSHRGKTQARETTGRLLQQGSSAGRILKVITPHWEYSVAGTARKSGAIKTEGLAPFLYLLQEQETTGRKECMADLRQGTQFRVGVACFIQTVGRAFQKV